MYKGENTFIDVREALFPLYCIVLSTFMEERDNEQKKKMKRSESYAWSEKEKKKLVVFMITITLFSGRTKKKHILCRSSFITLSLPVIPGSEIDSESGQTFSS